MTEKYHLKAKEVGLVNSTLVVEGSYPGIFYYLRLDLTLFSVSVVQPFFYHSSHLRYVSPIDGVASNINVIIITTWRR